MLGKLVKAFLPERHPKVCLEVRLYDVFRHHLQSESMFTI